MRNPDQQYIAYPANTIRIIQSHDFQFLKKYGQNFLIDLHVMEKIVRAAGAGPDDIVIEIGPGIGSLTQVLAEEAGRVIAVEIDRRLIPILSQNLAAHSNVEIVEGDFLKLDLPAFFKEKHIDRPVKVVANLPYYITTPIIMALFESGIPLDNVTVMVQEEVARRMQSGPGTKDYGALSLAVQYYASAYIAAYVPQNCFMPRPGVGSAVIRLTRFTEPPVRVQDEKLLFGLIRAAFAQRRKTLVHSIANSPELKFTKEEVAGALKELNLSETIRGEALDLEQFARLAEVLHG